MSNNETKLTPKDALKELMSRRLRKIMVMALQEAEASMYDESFDRFRSRILDCANDQIRMLTDDFEKFEVKWGIKRELFLPLNPKGSRNVT